jgi:hypothetical protein
MGTVQTIEVNPAKLTWSWRDLPLKPGISLMAGRPLLRCGCGTALASMRPASPSAATRAGRSHQFFYLPAAGIGPAMCSRMHSSAAHRWKSANRSRPHRIASRACSSSVPSVAPARRRNPTVTLGDGRMRILWGSNPHALADILFSRQVPSPPIGWRIHSLMIRNFRAFAVAVGLPACCAC